MLAEEVGACTPLRTLFQGLHLQTPCTFLTKVHMRSSAFVLFQQHKICSSNFFHDVIPYIRIPIFKRERERIFNYCFIDICGRFRQNLSLNCISVI